jgi:hypothetical protein
MEIGSNTRKLKVCYSIYQYSTKPHPLINVAGHYLSKFDFKVGDFVEMTIGKGKIVIKKTSK